MIATMSLYFLRSAGFRSHLMIAYGTDTFEVKDLMRIGIPLTIIALLLLVVVLVHVLALAGNSLPTRPQVFLRPALHSCLPLHRPYRNVFTLWYSSRDNDRRSI